MPLPLVRPVAFPLFGITSDGKCACGVETCERVGKHPRVKWKDIEWGQPVGHPEAGAGAGIKTGAHPKGSDCFVVDLDSEDAVERWDALGPPVETFTVATPRGWHLYFAHPGFHVGNSAGDLAKGIDIRGDGGFAVAPGSPHRSGGTYEVAVDVPIAPAPEWLLAWLKGRHAPAAPQAYAGDVSGVERARRKYLYAKWLGKEAPPCVQGAAGDQTLFEVVQRGAYDLELPTADVLELVREHYDPRCDPPWGDQLEERVRHKAADAKSSSTRPRAIPLPANLEHLAAGAGVTGPARLETIFNKPETKGESGIVWGRWDEPIEPPVYLVADLIPEAKVVTLYAEGGSLKSWAAFSLALAVATGEYWLGHAVKPGRALILDFEDGRYEFQRRKQILRGSAPEALPELGYWYCPPNLDSEELWSALLPLGLRLLVIDALGSGMPGDADENSTAFAAAVKIAGRFTETGCTVVIIHHANKSGGMRGTSAVRDQSDVAFCFEPVSETDDAKRMRMVCNKPGPQKKPKPVNVELSDAGLRTFEDAAADAGRNATTRTAIEAAILLHVTNTPGIGAERLKADIGGKGKKVSDAIAILLDERALRNVGTAGHKRLFIDTPALRRERVIEAARTCKGREAALATQAGVEADDVAEAIADGAIRRQCAGEVGGFDVL